MTDEVCELSDLPTSMCSHCRGHDVVELQDLETVGQPFDARVPGQCARCVHRIEQGDAILRVTDGDGYIHLACPRSLR